MRLLRGKYFEFNLAICSKDLAAHIQNLYARDFGQPNFVHPAMIIIKIIDPNKSVIGIFYFFKSVIGVD